MSQMISKRTAGVRFLSMYCFIFCASLVNAQTMTNSLIVLEIGSSSLTRAAAAHSDVASAGAVSLFGNEAELNALNKQARLDLEAVLSHFSIAQPDSAVNALRLDFAQRIQTARGAYWSGDNVTGHFTDRGKALILYGEPSWVLQGSSYFGGPEVEIWNYENQALEVTFIDETGLGEYRLSAPIGLFE